MVTLFDVKERFEKRPSRQNEDTYTYYNDSGREGINDIRNLLERWFAQFPIDEKNDLKARFQSSFNSAFFELFVHAYFTALGYELQVHPPVPGSTKRPDYLATKDENDFYIEVKCISTRSDALEGLERKLNTLYEALDTINAEKFLIQIDEVIFLDARQPKGNLIVTYFNEIVNKLDPNEYGDLTQDDSIDKFPLQTYEDDKVKVSLRFIPILKKHWGKSQRAIGIYPYESKIGGDEESIKSALSKKAKRYGDLEKPLLICLNKQSISVDEVELMSALFGSEAWSWPDDVRHREGRMVRIPDGLFGSKQNPKTTRLRAVLFTNANTANLASTAGMKLVHHPLAKKKLDFSLKMEIADVLKIPPTFPSNDFFYES